MQFFLRFLVMNMLSPLVRLQNSYLIIFCLFVCIHGREPDFPSCEVGLMVRRGTTRRSAPHQPLTVSCRVKHCGKPLDIIWCKLLDKNSCEQINKTEDVEIKQNSYTKNELISFLTFKWISVYDDGLYRCGNKKQKSHFINISVSDMHQGNEKTENTDNIAVVSRGDAGGEALSWLPYLYICVSIVLLVLTITLLTLLSFYGFKRIPTFAPTKKQEMSSHMIPDLPKGSAPSTPVLQARFVQNEVYFPSTAGTPTPPPSLITSRNQPLANTEDKSQDHAVYAVINRTMFRIPARKQQDMPEKPEYAAVNVS